MEEYQNKFEVLVSRAGILTQNQKIQLYISGLQESISIEVELHQPQDLVTAMSMSHLYEKNIYPKATTNRDNKHNPPITCTNCSIKRLTREEMEARRKKGLCYNCDETFVRGHQCKKLFWIDLEEENEPYEKMEQELSPEISLHGG